MNFEVGVAGLDVDWTGANVLVNRGGAHPLAAGASAGPAGKTYMMGLAGRAACQACAAPRPAVIVFLASACMEPAPSGLGVAVDCCTPAGAAAGAGGRQYSRRGEDANLTGVVLRCASVFCRGHAGPCSVWCCAGAIIAPLDCQRGLQTIFGLSGGEGLPSTPALRDKLGIAGRFRSTLGAP